MPKPLCANYMNVFDVRKVPDLLAFPAIETLIGEVTVAKQPFEGDVPIVDEIVFTNVHHIDVKVEPDVTTHSTTLLHVYLEQISLIKPLMPPFPAGL
jgi:hypothetical protein